MLRLSICPFVSRESTIKDILKCTKCVEREGLPGEKRSRSRALASENYRDTTTISTPPLMWNTTGDGGKVHLYVDGRTFRISELCISSSDLSLAAYCTLVTIRSWTVIWVCAQGLAPIDGNGGSRAKSGYYIVSVNRPLL